MVVNLRLHSKKRQNDLTSQIQAWMMNAWWWLPSLRTRHSKDLTQETVGSFRLTHTRNGKKQQTHQICLKHTSTTTNTPEFARRKNKTHCTTATSNYIELNAHTSITQIDTFWWQIMRKQTIRWWNTLDFIVNYISLPFKHENVLFPRETTWQTR